MTKPTFANFTSPAIDAATMNDLMTIAYDILGDGTSTPADKATAIANLALSASNSSFLQSGTGAVATDLQTRGRLVVYPQDFGCKGDGITDDAAGLNAALSCGAKVIDGAGKSYLIKSSITVPDGVDFINFTITIGTAGINAVLVSGNNTIIGKIVGSGTTSIVERGIYPAVDGASDVYMNVIVTNMTFGVQAQHLTTYTEANIPKRWRGIIYAYNIVGTPGTSEGYGCLLSPAESCELTVMAANVERHAVYLSDGAKHNRISLNADTIYNYACQLYSTSSQHTTELNTIYIKARNLQENVTGESGALAIVQNAHYNTVYLTCEGNNVAKYAATVQGSPGGPYPYQNRIICDGITGEFTGTDVINLLNADSTSVEGSIYAYATANLVATRSAGTNGSTHGGYFDRLILDGQGTANNGIYTEITTVPTYIGPCRIQNLTGSRVSDSSSGKRQGHTRRITFSGTTAPITAGSVGDTTVTLDEDVDTTSTRRAFVQITGASVSLTANSNVTAILTGTSGTVVFRIYNAGASDQTFDYVGWVEGD